MDIHSIARRYGWKRIDLDVDEILDSVISVPVL